MPSNEVMEIAEVAISAFYETGQDDSHETAAAAVASAIEQSEAWKRVTKMREALEYIERRDGWSGSGCCDKNSSRGATTHQPECTVTIARAALKEG